MSVYIKGMEMPSNCSRQGCPLFACIAAYKTGMICTVLNEYVEKGKKNPRCPLVPVPLVDEVICDHYKQKPRTKADSIRAMSNEDLADLIQSLIIDRNIGIPKETWLEWLNMGNNTVFGPNNDN